jgi:hypothetical protein
MGIEEKATNIESQGAPIAKYFGSLAISLIDKTDDSTGS